MTPRGFRYVVTVRYGRQRRATDGGVVVVGVPPGVYTWTGHKDGVTFSELRLRCEVGWLTNGVPPYGMNVIE